MLTIFTTPKPFVGHHKIIQENAIQSWKHLVPECEVILLGDDQGTANAADEFGCKHIKNVLCNEHGTPLISSLFSAAEKKSIHRILCYANADIMFTGTLLKAIEVVVLKDKFLMCGRRSNVDIVTSWKFNASDWEATLTAFVEKHGDLRSPFGLDYFIFPKNTLKNIPPLAVGRAGWDNWMVYNARKSLIPVIDATEAIMAIHQNHDYSHIQGGKQIVYTDGQEVKKNRAYLGQEANSMGTEDALFTLEKSKIRFPASRWLFHLIRLPILYPRIKGPIEIIRSIFRATKLSKLFKSHHRS